MHRHVIKYFLTNLKHGYKLNGRSKSKEIRLVLSVQRRTITWQSEGDKIEVMVKANQPKWPKHRKVYQVPFPLCDSRVNDVLALGDGERERDKGMREPFYFTDVRTKIKKKHNTVDTHLLPINRKLDSK